MTVQERLNELLNLACEHYGATNDAQLAKVLGIPHSTIWRWRKDVMLAPQAKFILDILNLLYPGKLPTAELVEA
jgi:transcriptional regulator with XRE-family HTH domain